MYCTQILTNHGAEQVNGSDIAQQVADDVSDTLETLKSTLQVSGWGQQLSTSTGRSGSHTQETARRAEVLYSMHQNRNCCSPACWYGSGYDASLCSMLCNTSSIKYISSGRQFGIETGQNATQQCEMGVWEPDSESCPAVDDEMEETAVHIPRDMHEEGMERVGKRLGGDCSLYGVRCPPPCRPGGAVLCAVDRPPHTAVPDQLSPSAIQLNQRTVCGQ